MKKLSIAVLAGLMSIAVGAYAAEDMKKDSSKSGSSMSKGGSASTTGSTSSSATTGAGSSTATTTGDTTVRRSRPARAAKG